MKQYFKTQFPLNNIAKDILSGIIVMLVSIPIALGYASVAGLPPVYGLYGSLIPILVFGFISSSKIFVVGVDAMPAAMVGALLVSLGIEAGSEEAIAIVPVITLLVACWFIVFAIIKAGRIVKYISNPVMGGFITGVGLTIIMMILPKVFGGTAGTGEMPALVINLVKQWQNYKPIPILLGVGTVIIIQVAKRFIPKVPMSVVVMVIGGLLSAFLPLTDYGVVMLPDAPGGLPKFALPQVALILENPKELLIESLMIAGVIMAQTLLASNSYAQKYDFKLNNTREIIGYSAMNIAGAAVGICPINGSVSRSGLADGFGAKSHWMSISASLGMLLVLLFGTPLLKYLPTPVMTGVVVCALIGILDFKQLRRLWKTDRREVVIFLTAMAGVLIFGTIYGVIIGMILSFMVVIMKAVIPPRAFLGQIPGHGNDFYNLKRNRGAKPIVGTVIYRFGGNLFFGNIGTFADDIEGAITKDTKQIIVDARGIGNIDITAADRLLILHRKLQKRGIKFYITEHGGQLNDQLRTYGAGEMIREGAVRRTISLALRDAGVDKPYPLVGESGEVLDRDNVMDFVEADERLAEFEWVFGKDAESAMEEIAAEIAGKLVSKKESDISNDVDSIEDAEGQTSWGRVGLFDEDELLDYLEIQIRKMSDITPENKTYIQEKIEKRRHFIEAELEKINPKAEDLLHDHRLKLARHMREKHPEEYSRIIEWESKHGKHHE